MSGKAAVAPKVPDSVKHSEKETADCLAAINSKRSEIKSNEDALLELGGERDRLDEALFEGSAEEDKLLAQKREVLARIDLIAMRITRGKVALQGLREVYAAALRKVELAQGESGLAELRGLNAEVEALALGYFEGALPKLQRVRELAPAVRRLLKKAHHHDLGVSLEECTYVGLFLMAPRIPAVAARLNGLEIADRPKGGR